MYILKARLLRPTAVTRSRSNRSRMTEQYRNVFSLWLYMYSLPGVVERLLKDAANKFQLTGRDTANLRSSWFNLSLQQDFVNRNIMLHRQVL